MPDLTSSSITFLNTVAQISFTVTGLIVVAVAADRETRAFWYSRRARAAYVNLHFLLLVSPGFVALGTLIQPKPDTTALSIAASCWGVFVAWAAIIALPDRNDKDEHEEFLRLEDKITKIRRLAILFGVLLVILGAGRLTAFVDLVYVSLTVLLILFLLSGVFSIALLLRAYEKLRQDDAEQKQPAQPEPQRTAVQRAPAAEAKPAKTPAWAAGLVTVGLLVIGAVLANRGKR